MATPPNRIYIKLANGSRIGFASAGKQIYLSDGPSRQVFKHTLRGNYRIEDTSLIRYELYEGIDAQPNFNAAPWQTFAALPFTTPALAVGHTYNFVLRKRNQHNLVSQNVGAYTLVLDGGGNSTLAPSAPSFASMVQAAGGAGLINATYDAINDPAGVQADTWAVWLTSDGSTPNPSNPATYTQAMIQSDGQPKLIYTTAQFANGTVLKAIVRTRRTGTPNVDSTNVNVLSIICDAIGPNLPASAGVFFGEAANQAPIALPAGGASVIPIIRQKSTGSATPAPPQRGRIRGRPKFP